MGPRGEAKVKRRKEARATWPLARITACRGSYSEEILLNPKRTWTGVERQISQDFGAGRLVRIARPDGRHNYTAPGRYEVTFSGEKGDEWSFAVDLEERGA